MRMVGKLVGTKFARGADVALLEMFGEFAAVIERDPTNKYDKNAIRVLVTHAAIPPKALDRVTAEFGKPADPLMPGHIAKEDAAEIAPELDARPGAVVRLDLNSRHPVVHVMWE